MGVSAAKEKKKYEFYLIGVCELRHHDSATFQIELRERQMSLHNRLSVSQLI